MSVLGILWVKEVSEKHDGAEQFIRPVNIERELRAQANPHFVPQIELLPIENDREKKKSSKKI